MARNEDTPENNDDLMEKLLDKVNKMELEIAELKKQLADAQPFYNPPPLPFNDFDRCIDDNGHEYPNPWHSILPPHCKKCGKQAPDYGITFTTNTSDVPWDFNKHGGNVMNNQNPIITHNSTTSNSKYISDTSGIF